MWPFTPGWNSKNPQKRLKAVAKISDPAKLVEIAQKSMYTDARKKAVTKISDPDKLLEIVYSGVLSDAREEAILHISDTATLLKIFEDFSTGWRARSAGVTLIPFLLNQIQDQEALAKIVEACPKQEWQTQAANRITDPEIAERVASQVSDWKARVTLYTVSNNEQKVIYEIALHAEGEESLEAVNKIMDEEILYSVAINGHRISVRDKAAEKITNQDILAKIALDSRGSLSAISRITDQRILISLLESAPEFIHHYSVHHQIIRQLHEVNKHLIVEMAAQNEDSKLKQLAIQYLGTVRAIKSRELGLGSKLLEACKTDSGLAVIKGLLDAGADPDWRGLVSDKAVAEAMGGTSDSLQVSALYYAILNRNQQLADMLMEYGASLRAWQVYQEEWRDTGSIHDWGEHVTGFAEIPAYKLVKFASDYGITLGSAW